MGILSGILSVTRYRVEKEIQAPVNENILRGLEEFAFPEIVDDQAEVTAGWTTPQRPYEPVFNDMSFILGEWMIFSLRIDKKIIPPTLFKKNLSEAIAKKAGELGVSFLARSQKDEIADEVKFNLLKRIPATPYIYDLLWHYESRRLFFFTTLKSANEVLESLFLKSFKVRLIRLFPYTAAEATSSLSNEQRDRLMKIKPILFDRIKE